MSFSHDQSRVIKSERWIMGARHIKMGLAYKSLKQSSNIIRTDQITQKKTLTAFSVLTGHPIRQSKWTYVQDLNKKSRLQMLLLQINLKGPGPSSQTIHLLKQP